MCLHRLRTLAWMCASLMVGCAPMEDPRGERATDDVGRHTFALGGALPAPPMSVGRSRHSATLLPQGTVLVAGGELTGALTSAELYDPFTHTWTRTADHGGHVWHGSALLPTGKVIVFDVTTAGTELYDPAQGTWQDVADPPTKVDTVAPVMLPTGRLLVAGGDPGSSGQSHTNAVSLLDPQTLSFSAAAPLVTARQLSPTVLLADGRVLVVGGYADTYLQSSELYDPIEDRWTWAAPLDAPLGFSNAFLLPSRRVLAYAGVSSRRSQLYDPSTDAWSEGGPMVIEAERSAAVMLPSGRVLSLGGTQQGAGAQLYDPDTNVWTVAPSMAVSREDHTATLLPTGRVLIAGGSNLSSTELYDPQTPTWRAAADLLQARSHATATLLPRAGEVLVAGGHDGQLPVATVERFDPTTGTWTTAATLTTPRAAHRATLLHDGRVLVTGGFSAEGAALASAELYDPATDTWSPVGAMDHPRAWHTATLLPSGAVMVAGGAPGSPASVELFDPDSTRWTALAPMATGRTAHTATLLPTGSVLVTGGGTNDCERYDVAENRWSKAATMPASSPWQTATLLPSGAVLVALGGTQSAVLWSPTTDAWSVLPALPRSIDEHTATLLRNGDVLLLGSPNGAQLEAVLFNVAANAWRSVSTAVRSRGMHASVMLADGRVLAIGGRDASGVRSSVDLFDEGRGARPQWTPSLIDLSPAVAGEVSLNGTLFTGTHAGGGGKYSSSKTNFPVLVVRRLDNEWTRILPTRGWTASSALASVPGDLPPGNYLAHVVVNGTDGPGVAWSHAPTTNRLRFETQPRTFTASRCPAEGQHIQVSLEDAAGNPVAAPSGGQVFTAVSTSTGTVSWYADPGCTTPVTGGRFTVPPGSSTVDVYYVDTTAGTPVIRLTNTSGLTNPPAQQHEVREADPGDVAEGCGCGASSSGSAGLAVVVFGALARISRRKASRATAA